MPDPTGREAVAAVWRIESARIVGALARYTGDFALAEDLAQEALAEALVSWPREGVPGNPAGWLLTVGRRRAIDAFRRRSALDERYAALARDLGEGGTVSGTRPAPPSPSEQAGTARTCCGIRIRSTTTRSR
jgi:predicted RNA polymerase sigma factor